MEELQVWALHFGFNETLRSNELNKGVAHPLAVIACAGQAGPDPGPSGVAFAAWLTTQMSICALRSNGLLMRCASRGT